MKEQWDSKLRRYVTPGEDQPVDIRAHGIEFQQYLYYESTKQNSSREV